MQVLVSGATTVVRQLAREPELRPHLGVLLTPDDGNSIPAALDLGLDVGIDNSCFVRLDAGAIVVLWGKLRMALGEATPARLRFCTLPDVVADAEATMALFYAWRPVLQLLGLPAALVAQDGLERLALPWDAIDCLFIGGSTAWKEGPHAFDLAREARARGKHVHVGRVNTERREALCWKMRAHSFDGTQYSRFSRAYLRRCRHRLRSEPHLIEEVLAA